MGLGALLLLMMVGPAFLNDMDPFGPERKYMKPIDNYGQSNAKLGTLSDSLRRKIPAENRFKNLDDGDSATKVAQRKTLRSQPTQKTKHNRPSSSVRLSSRDRSTYKLRKHKPRSIPSDYSHRSLELEQRGRENKYKKTQKDQKSLEYYDPYGTFRIRKNMYNQEEESIPSSAYRHRRKKEQEVDNSKWSRGLPPIEVELVINRDDQHPRYYSQEDHGSFGVDYFNDAGNFDYTDQKLENSQRSRQKTKTTFDLRTSSMRRRPQYRTTKPSTLKK